MRHIFRWMITCGLLAACAPGLSESASNPRRQPPPQPGSSITHSKMCSCTACPVARCCGGESAADENASEKTCKDSYDFSSEACALSVGSCVGKCYEEVWRVSLSEECDDERPAECCG